MFMTRYETLQKTPSPHLKTSSTETSQLLTAILIYSFLSYSPHNAIVSYRTGTLVEALDLTAFH